MGMGGLGTLLGYADALAAAGGATPYTLIGGVIKISPQDVAARDIPFGAALDNSTLGHKGHAVGSDDTTPLTFDLPYDAASKATLLSLRRLTRQIIVVYPDGDADLFPGYFQKDNLGELDADKLFEINAAIVRKEAPVRHEGWGAPVVFTVPLVAGHYVIDLSSIPGYSAGVSRLKRLAITNLPTNADYMALYNDTQNVPSNAYEWIPGDGRGYGGLRPGKTFVWEGDNASAVADSTHKLLSLQGVGAETATISVTLGA